MPYDDDPYNEADDERRARKYGIVAIVVFCVAVFALLAWLSGVKVKAQDRGYLPPEKYYTQNPRAAQRPVEAEEPQQYYANDWIVYAPDGRVLCKDPYIELDLKVVRCIEKMH